MRLWAAVLAAVPALVAIPLVESNSLGAGPALIAAAGLALFGLPFAVNSALHSYLILAYAGSKKAAEDMGFYYAANAAGRSHGRAAFGPAVPDQRIDRLPGRLVRHASGVRGDRVRAADRGEGAGRPVAPSPRGAIGYICF